MRGWRHSTLSAERELPQTRSPGVSLRLNRFSQGSIGADLSESEQEMYDSIQEEINLPLRYQFDDVVQASFYFHLNGELYAHSNGEEFTNEEDWSYSFTDRLPMIEMEAEFLFDDTFYMFTDLSYGRNRYTDRDTFGRFNVESEDNGEGLVKDIDGDGQYLVSSSIFSESVLTNWMSSTYDVDFQTPKRSVIAAVGGALEPLAFARPDEMGERAQRQLRDR